MILVEFNWKIIYKLKLVKKVKCSYSNKGRYTLDIFARDRPYSHETI